jgi:ParB/RepB/Spo0J family partition protein
MDVQLGFKSNYDEVKDTVHLSNLPCNKDLIGDKPSNQLIQDMANRGQITPIKVALTERGPFVIAGTRRIKAARELEWEFIDAIFVEMSYDDALWERSAENNIRSNNDKADIDAVREGIHRGMSDREISSRTGASYGRIKKLRKFLDLPSKVAAYMDDETISTRTAEAIAKMDPSFWPNVEESIALAIANKKKFTTSDVEDLQRAGVANTYEQVLFDLPDSPEMEEEQVFIGYVTIDKDCVVVNGIFPEYPTDIPDFVEEVGEVYIRRKLNDGQGNSA